MRTPSLKFPLLLAIMATVTTSCSDSPTAPVDLATLQVARCAPDTTGIVTMTIGRDGGTISLGRNRLVVPRRSLDHNVEISMQILGDSSSSVIFLPEGLRFQESKPAAVTLSYRGCDFSSDSAPALRTGITMSHHPDDDDDDDDHSGHHHGDDSAPSTLGVVYTSDDLQILDYLSGVSDSTNQQVTAEISHFSRYAVAW